MNKKIDGVDDMLAVVLLLIGFLFLVKGADLFVDSCSRLARALGISTLIIGLTIVSFGTSAPEAAVSVIASLQNANAISMGNVVGSNICNLLLVLGVSGIFGNLTVKRKIVYRDMVYSLFSYVVIFIIAMGALFHETKTAMITRSHGLILLCFLGIYFYSLLVDMKHTPTKEEEKVPLKKRDIPLSLLGLAGILVGGELVVQNACAIARMIGVSESVIALTVVAIGTSLPELVTSVMAARKGEADMAIGNVIGSNIFNIFFILGISSAVSPIPFGVDTLIDIIWMMVAGLLVFLLVLKNYRIGRKKGPFLVLMYISYMIYILLR